MWPSWHHLHGYWQSLANVTLPNLLVCWLKTFPKVVCWLSACDTKVFTLHNHSHHLPLPVTPHSQSCNHFYPSPWPVVQAAHLCQCFQVCPDLGWLPLHRIDVHDMAHCLQLCLWGRLVTTTALQNHFWARLRRCGCHFVTRSYTLSCASANLTQEFSCSFTRHTGMFWFLALSGLPYMFFPSISLILPSNQTDCWFFSIYISFLLH